MKSHTKEDINTKAAVRPIQEGMHTVTPHLICAGAADALEFYKKAFDAVELSRMVGPNGMTQAKIASSGMTVAE